MSKAAELANLIGNINAEWWWSKQECHHQWCNECGTRGTSSTGLGADAHIL